MEIAQRGRFLDVALASMSHVQISSDSGRYLKCTHPHASTYMHTLTLSTLTYIFFKEGRAKPEGYVYNTAGRLQLQFRELNQ